MSITKINIACTYQLFAVKTKLIFNFYSSKILGEPNFMAAMNVPGWDVVTLNNMAIKFDPSSINTGNSFSKVGWYVATLNNMAIKFDPSSINTGNSYSKVGWDVATLNIMTIKFDPSSINTDNSYQEVGSRMLQLLTLIPPACVHKGHTLFELPIS